jgi:hypothetical protein
MLRLGCPGYCTIDLITMIAVSICTQTQRLIGRVHKSACVRLQLGYGDLQVSANDLSS